MEAAAREGAAWAAAVRAVAAWAEVAWAEVAILHRIPTVLETSSREEWSMGNLDMLALHKRSPELDQTRPQQLPQPQRSADQCRHSTSSPDSQTHILPTSLFVGMSWRLCTCRDMHCRRLDPMRSLLQEG